MSLLPLKSILKVMAYTSASNWLTLNHTRHLSCKGVLEMYREGIYLGGGWIDAESIPNVFYKNPKEDFINRVTFGPGLKKYCLMARMA